MASSEILRALPEPVIQAPMAGGPSTSRLAAAVSAAGGLGFLAAGYQSVEAVGADIHSVRALTARPFGLNVFLSSNPADGADVAFARYAQRMAPEAERLGVAVGAPRWDDDAWEAKVALACRERVPVVSFTFGCPSADTVRALHAAGSEVWVTVTEPGEAAVARDAGADALVVQGLEAGGHRASFSDEDGRGLIGLLALLRLVTARVVLPLVGTGGVADGAAVAAVLAAGAQAAALGTAFMCTPEAGTSAAHRTALQGSAHTGLTRAFSGRRARGIANRFMSDHDGHAPPGYPQVHHLTAPLRAAARERGDQEAINLWAGQAHELTLQMPAAELVANLGAQARESLTSACRHARVAPESSQSVGVLPPPTVEIKVRDDGPYRVTGPARLIDAEGGEWQVESGRSVVLCRCGHSAKRPFCDGAHHGRFSSCERAGGVGVAP